LTVCAERNAVFQAVSKGESDIVAVAVYTPTPTATTPCGAGRQVINEFSPGAEVICSCDGPEELHVRLTELLPGAFGPRNLSESGMERT
jgi:cytidine deaminase